jgi:hypothetical protein
MCFACCACVYFFVDGVVDFSKWANDHLEQQDISAVVQPPEAGEASSASLAFDLPRSLQHIRDHLPKEIADEAVGKLEREWKQLDPDNSK